MLEPQRKNILVVDDEICITDSLNLVLTELGFQIFTAHSFAEASAIVNNSASARLGVRAKLLAEYRRSFKI